MQIEQYNMKRTKMKLSSKTLLLISVYHDKVEEFDALVQMFDISL